MNHQIKEALKNINLRINNIEKSVAALRTNELAATDSQQLKAAIALLQRWKVFASDIGVIDKVHPSLINETNAVIVQQAAI